MARFSLEQVKEELNKLSLDYIDGEYKNLDSLINVECEKGHTFITSLRAARKGVFCPTCSDISKPNTNESLLNIPRKKGYRILALDNATHQTGFAIFENQELIEHGVKNSSKNKTALERITEMKQWLVSSIDVCEIDFIGLEGVQLQRGNPQTLITLAKLLGALEVAAFEKTGRNPSVVSASSWKSFSKIKGKNRQQQKENAQKMVKKLYGMVVSQDAADAILLGRYVSHQSRFGEENTW